MFEQKRNFISLINSDIIGFTLFCAITILQLYFTLHYYTIYICTKDKNAVDC